MSKHNFTPYKPYDEDAKLVYVSGPMTGYKDNNFPSFDGAAEELRVMGYSVCSPSETDQYLGVHLSHEQYLRFDFARVLEADFLVALRGWERSLGAISEILVAVRIGIKVWRWDTFSDFDRITYEDIEAAISNMHGSVGDVNRAHWDFGMKTDHTDHSPIVN